jgi:hypothetical protein
VFVGAVSSISLCSWAALNKPLPYFETISLSPFDKPLSPAKRLLHSTLDDINDLRYVNVVEAELSTKPAAWTGKDIASVKGAQLRYATLEHADMRGAFLVNAELGGVHLTGADLSDADLRGAKFSDPLRVFGELKRCLRGAVHKQRAVRKARPEQAEIRLVLSIRARR